MKKILLLFTFFIFHHFSFGQAITFGYDASGNRVSRLASSPPVAGNGQRYLGLCLVNENDDPQLDLIQKAKDSGLNAVLLSIQWGSIHGYISRLLKEENGANYNVWQQYDAQIAKARSLGMKVAINVVVSTGDDLSNSSSGPEGVVTGDGWTPYERVQVVRVDGNQQAVFQKSGGYIRPGKYLQFVMTSLAAQSTKNRIADFGREVTQRYKYLQDADALLYMDVIWSRAGEGEFDFGSDKFNGSQSLDLAESLSDYSVPMVLAFRTWLTNKYGNIGNLNSKWQTSYGSFGDIQPKKPSGSYVSAFTGPNGNDWYLFRTQILKETNEMFKDVVKSEDPRIKVILQNGSTFDRLSLRRSTFSFNEFGSNLDGIKFNDGGDFDHRFSMDLMRTNLPGKLIINEAEYNPNYGIGTYVQQATESFTHGAQIVSLFQFAAVLDAGHQGIIRNLADTWVTNQSPTIISASNSNSFTLSSMINNDGCSTTNRTNYSGDCEAYRNWNAAYSSGGNRPVNIFIQNDLVAPGCPSVFASNSNVTVTPNSPLTLSTSCSGDCSGITYSWSGNGVSGSGSSLTISAPSTPGTYSYSVQMTKNGCSFSPVTFSVVVSNTTTAFNCTTIQSAVEYSSCEYIGGWVYDSSNPNAAVTLDLYEGNTLISANVAANEFRQDLVNAGFGNGMHGFKFYLPASLKNGQNHVISLRVSGCSATLSNSQKTINCEGSAPSTDGCYTLKLSSNNLMLTNVNGVLKVKTSDNSESQKWHLESSNGFVKVKAPGGLVLGVENGGNTVDNLITLQVDNGQDHQLWTQTVLSGSNAGLTVFSRKNSALRFGSTLNYGAGDPSASVTDIRLSEDAGNTFGGGKWIVSSTGCSTSTCPVVSASNGNISASPNTAQTLSTSCSGDCSGITYSWSGNGVSGSGSSLTISAPSTPGTYSYSVQMTKNGCSFSPVTFSVVVSNTTTAFNCTTIQSAVEYSSCEYIGGWVYDSSNPNAAVTLDLYEGNTLISANVAANEFRQDLVNAGFGNGMHGFKFYLPASLKNGQNHVISLRVSGCSATLSNSQKTINCEGSAPSTDGCYTLKLSSNNLMLTNVNGVLKVKTSDNSESQKWHLESSNGFVKVKAPGGLVLGVENGGNTVDNLITLQVDNGQDHQLWTQTVLSGSNAGLTVFSRKNSALRFGSTLNYGAGDPSASVTDIRLSEDAGNTFGGGKWIVSSTGCSTSTCPVVSASNGNISASPNTAQTLSTSCSGDCSGITYSWSGNGVSGSGSSLTISAPSTPGTYSYSVQMTKNGCSFSPVTFSVVVSNTTTAFNCTTIQSAVEYSSCEYIGGWVYDSSNPNAAVTLDLYEGNTLISANVAANEFRQDLVNAGFGNGMHGFKFYLPASLKNGQNHVISLRVSGCSATLSNSQKTINCEGSAPSTDGCYTLKLSSNNLMLTNVNGVLKVKTSDNSESQKWHLESSNGFVKVKAPGGLVLGVENGGNTVDNLITLQVDNGQDHQLWTQTVLSGSNAGLTVFSRKNSALRFGSTLNYGAGDPSASVTDIRLSEDAGNTFGGGKWIVSSTGCSTSTCPVVSASNGNISASPNTAQTLSTSCSGDCSGITYSWSGNGVSGSGSSLTISAPSTPGTYSYSVQMTKNGCSFSPVTFSVVVQTSAVTGCYTLKVASKSLVLTNVNGVLKVKASDNSDSQKWKLEPYGNYVKVYAQDNRLLGVDNGGNSADNQLTLQADSNQDHQLWTQSSLGSDTYAFTRKNSTLVFGSTLNNGDGDASNSVSDIRLTSDPGNVYGSNKWVVTQVGCTNTTTPTVSVNCNTVQSNVESAVCGSIGGWVYDPSNPNSQLSIDVYEGSTLIQAGILAGNFRQDLVNAGFGNGQHGFQFSTPASLKNGQNHVITLRVSGCSSVLANSQRTINCSPNARIAASDIVTEEPELSLIESQNLTVYPNPNNGNFEAVFNLSAGETGTLSVLDDQGNKYFERPIKGIGQHKEKIILTNNISGLYLVVLRTDKKLLTKKVIVIK